jgi:hypothetical protein
LGGGLGIHEGGVDLLVLGSAGRGYGGDRTSMVMWRLAVRSMWNESRRLSHPAKRNNNIIIMTTRAKSLAEGCESGGEVDSVEFDVILLLLLMDVIVCTNECVSPSCTPSSVTRSLDHATVF